MSKFLLAKMCRDELGLLLTYSLYIGNVKEVQMILDEVQMRNFLEGLEVS